MALVTVPGQDVVVGFGLSGEPELLAGGQGGTYAIGDTVLKAEGAEDAAAWAAAVMAGLPQNGFRVPAPRPRCDGGGWSLSGWTAWERVAGEHRLSSTNWYDALEVAVGFHEALRTAPRPVHLARRTDLFAVADRMAWGEQALPSRGRLAEVLDALARHRVEVEGPCQVIHGDLAGNLLWHEDLPPAVIDMSPYWRPGGLGAAQLVTDASLWYGAGLELAESFLAHEPGVGRQLVLRALIFRLAVDAQLDGAASSDVRWDATQIEWDLDHARPLAAWATGEELW